MNGCMGICHLSTFSTSGMTLCHSRCGKYTIMISFIGSCHLFNFSTLRMTAVSFAMWKHTVMHKCALAVIICHFSTSGFTAVSFAIWTTGNYDQLSWQLSRHWQLSYVVIFHIATDRRVSRALDNCNHEQFRLHLSYSLICHIATDCRVNRDVANWQL